MNVGPLPFDAPLERYEARAEELRTENGNRGLDEARLAVARVYDFRDWEMLAAWVADVQRVGSEVHRFESAVEAVVTGDETALASLLRAHPDLVRARSTRVTSFDPPVHRATLLHYVAANGVESHRQRTPPNAVAIASLLLDAGAEPDALADMYGEPCTTMSMLVSSSHPADAGVQVALVDRLVDAGASVGPCGGEAWGTPLGTALAFGYLGAAQALVRRGARADDLPSVSGLGLLDEAKRMLPGADALARHRALVLAAQLGHVEVVRLLLDAGEDPNRYNPPRLHAHSTPIHQAIVAGHLDVVRLLVERGARVDQQDRLHGSTPLGWASYLGKKDIETFLLRLS